MKNSRLIKMTLLSAVFTLAVAFTQTASAQDATPEKKEEKKEKSPLSQNNKEQNEVQYFSEAYTFSSKVEYPEKSRNLTVYSFSLTTSAPGNIFQPPKC